MAQSNSNAFLGAAIMLLLPAYLILQIWCGSAWKGLWRAVALIPSAGFAPALILALIGLAHQSNLWSITVILFAPIGYLYPLLAALAGALLARRRMA
jgi:hypothetical protein